MTGFTNFYEYAISGKWLSLLKEIAPSVRRVTVMQNPNHPSWVGYQRSIAAAAPLIGVQPVEARIYTPADIDNTFDVLMREPNGGLLVLPDTFNTVHRAKIIALAARHRIPAVYPQRFYATDGGLMAYGADFVELLRLAASYVDHILRGARPTDLPVQSSSKFELVINLKTARMLGLDRAADAARARRRGDRVKTWGKGKPAVKLPRRKFLHLAAGAATLSAVSRIAWAQAYPSRPIRLVVPFPPGGAYDLVGRPLADKLKPLLGTVVIENIGGGGASLGAAAVVRAPPDGYTILLGGTQTHVNEALLKSRPLYDPVKDLDPIASVAANCLVIAVHPSLPVRTLKELIAYAKANPGKLSYGHAGVGSIQHLTGELLKSLAETPDIVQVPYRGTGPAIADLVSGQVPMGIVGVTGPLLEFHRSGKTRILAVTNPTRLNVAPELPTAAELGIPGLTVTGTIGLLAPAGTPTGIIERIAQATRSAVAEPAYQQLLIDAGIEPTLNSTPDKFRRSLAADVALWTPVVKALGLKID